MVNRSTVCHVWSFEGKRKEPEFKPVNLTHLNGNGEDWQDIAIILTSQIVNRTVLGNKIKASLSQLLAGCTDAI